MSDKIVTIPVTPLPGEGLQAKEKAPLKLVQRSKSMYEENPRDCWRTPKRLFDYLNEIHHFRADMAATADNALCNIFYSDSLNITWPSGWVWCNPPFSMCAEFTRKAICMGYGVDCAHDVKSLLLLPGHRTEQKWWHELIQSGATVHYISPCVPYDPPPGVKATSPSFPSVLVTVGAKPLLPPTLDLHHLFGRRTNKVEKE
jgi:site-specific DNA-methyltransferase (adenine-specific)